MRQLLLPLKPKILVFGPGPPSHLFVSLNCPVELRIQFKVRMYVVQDPPLKPPLVKFLLNDRVTKVLKRIESGLSNTIIWSSRHRTARLEEVVIVFKWNRLAQLWKIVSQHIVQNALSHL
jgi:hypothetical protein